MAATILAPTKKPAVKHSTRNQPTTTRYTPENYTLTAGEYTISANRGFVSIHTPGRSSMFVTAAPGSSVAVKLSTAEATCQVLHLEGEDGTSQAIVTTHGRATISHDTIEHSTSAHTTTITLEEECDLEITIHPKSPLLEGCRD